LKDAGFAGEGVGAGAGESGKKYISFIPYLTVCGKDVIGSLPRTYIG